ncbi:hypothetical protein V2J09_008820 [Rumex salicifolius]
MESSKAIQLDRTTSNTSEDVLLVGLVVRRGSLSLLSVRRGTKLLPLNLDTLTLLSLVTTSNS